MPFSVDRTPPIAGEVYDGPTPSDDLQYQDDTTSLCVSWAGFSDPDSGLGRIEWVIGEFVMSGKIEKKVMKLFVCLFVCAGRTAGDARIPGRDLNAEEVAVGVACRQGLSLVHNSTYVSTLTFYNGAMDPLGMVGASDGGESTPEL